MASITSSGTCVPPGPSKKASGERSAEKRRRTASTSKATVLIAPTLPDGVAPVHAPAVARLRAQRGADEAVALRLRQELAQRVARRRRRQLDVELDLEIDE